MVKLLSYAATFAVFLAALPALPAVSQTISRDVPAATSPVWKAVREPAKARKSSATIRLERALRAADEAKGAALKAEARAARLAQQLERTQLNLAWLTTAVAAFGLGGAWGARRLWRGRRERRAWDVEREAAAQRETDLGARLSSIA